MHKLVDYFGMAEATLSERIKNTHNGKGYSEVKVELIGNKIKALVREGLILPKDLEPYFEDLDCDEVFNLMKKVDNGKLLKGIITTLISMGIAHVDSGHSYGYILYQPLAEYMGLSKVSALGKFIRYEMDTYLPDLDLELYLRPLAWFMIENSIDALDLLENIGWGFGTDFQRLRPFRRLIRINERIHKLFGTSYEKAKIQSTTSFIGDLI